MNDYQAKYVIIRVKYLILSALKPMMNKVV